MICTIVYGVSCAQTISICGPHLTHLYGAYSNIHPLHYHPLRNVFKSYSILVRFVDFNCFQKFEQKVNKPSYYAFTYCIALSLLSPFHLNQCRLKLHSLVKCRERHATIYITEDQIWILSAICLSTRLNFVNSKSFKFIDTITFMFDTMIQ